MGVRTDNILITGGGWINNETGSCVSIPFADEVPIVAFSTGGNYKVDTIEFGQYSYSCPTALILTHTHNPYEVSNATITSSAGNVFPALVVTNEVAALEIPSPTYTVNAVITRARRLSANGPGFFIGPHFTDGVYAPQALVLETSGQSGMYPKLTSPKSSKEHGLYLSGNIRLSADSNIYDKDGNAIVLAGKRV